jgi:hypothetical protein
VSQVYKINKTFIAPFIIAVALLFVLLVLCLFSGQTWEIILLAVLCVITMGVAVEAFEREFVVSEDGLRMKKFFRTKSFSWAEITHLGIVIMRNKVYVLLTTTKGFYVLSNLLQDHTLLIRFLTDKLGDEKVEPEIKNYLEHPIERTSLFIMTWVVLIVIVAIIVTKLIKL